MIAVEEKSPRPFNDRRPMFDGRNSDRCLSWPFSYSLSAHIIFKPLLSVFLLPLLNGRSGGILPFETSYLLIKFKSTLLPVEGYSIHKRGNFYFS